MEDMIKMLGSAHEEQRQQMMTEPLKRIAGQPEPIRLNSVKDMITAISNQNDEAKAVLIATRTMVIAQLPAEERDTLLLTRVKVGKDLPEPVNKMDMMLTMKAVGQWPSEKQQMFKQLLGQAFEKAGMPKPNFDEMMG